MVLNDFLPCLLNISSGRQFSPSESQSTFFSHGCWSYCSAPPLKALQRFVTPNCESAAPSARLRSVETTLRTRQHVHSVSRQIFLLFAQRTHPRGVDRTSTRHDRAMPNLMAEPLGARRQEAARSVARDKATPFDSTPDKLSTFGRALLCKRSGAGAWPTEMCCRDTAGRV